MEKRFDPKALAPAIYDAQIKLGMAVKTCGLDLALIELAQVRASQINGCAYCLILHLANARKAGVSQRKLDLIAAWRDTPDFDARERAAIAWSETLTHISHGGVSDEAYQAVREAFNETEIAQLSFAIGLINAWNRVMVAAQVPPP